MCGVCATTYERMNATFAQISRHFLTAFSREVRRLGFPPLFDNCQRKRQTNKEGKSRLFSTLKKKAKAEITREISLSCFGDILLKKVASLYSETCIKRTPLGNAVASA